MRNMLQRPAVPRPEDDKDKLKRKPPLPEGLRALGEEEVDSVLEALCGRRARRVRDAYDDAKKKLEALKAELEIVQTRQGGLRLFAQCELKTSDRTLDEDLADMASGMGYRLTLRSVPVTGGPQEGRFERMERLDAGGGTVVYHVPKSTRTYVVREGPSVEKDVERVDRKAGDLLRLLGRLRELMDEKAPMNVVPMPASGSRGPVCETVYLDESKAVAMRA